ncbi:Hypothetical predicted protein [Mytilus galloprovincialis]|uniref:Uncharacterized protein n=1 Tax=Mytilus galloprovincialis TaxID=29158 RepID=A0A8B6HQ47_MYTGA|nr:Hypothetical predicted protein [Mytilus galloprovincialis]
MPYQSAFDVPYQIYRCLFENATKRPKNTRVAMVTPRKATQKSPMKPVNYGNMTQSTTESHRPDTPVLGRCYVRDTHFHSNRVQTSDPTFSRNRQTTARALLQVRTAFEEPKRIRLIWKKANCEPAPSKPFLTLALGNTTTQVTKFRLPPHEKHDGPPPKKTKREFENLNKHIASDHDFIQDTDSNSEVILWRKQRQVCKCIHENEIKSRIVEMPKCIYWDPSKMENVDDVFSISRRSIPIFKFKRDKGNEQCVSIRKNSTSMSLNYQFRLCSDHLPVLCEDENDSNYLCSKIIAGGAVTFAAIIIFLVGIIFILRRKLANASYTTLTVRRDQNNYNDVPNQMSVSIIGQYYEMSAASETHASTVQQNINQIQHIDTYGYLIPSGMLETDGDYQTIAD